MFNLKKLSTSVFMQANEKLGLKNSKVYAYNKIHFSVTICEIMCWYMVNIFVCETNRW